jgi:DNA-binding beta-propeller fold protein YncE
VRAAAGVLAAALAVACTAPNATDGSASPSTSPRSTSETFETFEIGGYPNGIAYSHGSLWVGDPDASELLRVDPVTGTIAERISAGDGSFLVAASGGDLWVSDHLAGTVSRFEPLDGSLVQTIRVGAFPTSVIDRGSALYAVGGPAATVHRIDPRTGHRETVLRFRDELESIAFTSGSIWLTAYGGHVVQRYDERTGRPVGEIDIGRSAWALAETDNRLWVSNRDEGTVSAVDPEGGVVATVALPSGASPFGLWALAGRLWAADADRGILYEIDPALASLVATHELPSPAIAMAAAGGDVWATSGDSGSLVRMEAPPVEAAGFEGDGTPLPPGRYAYSDFAPSLSFEIGPGWIGGHMHAQFFDVQREEGVLLGFARPAFVLGARDEVEAGGLAPEDALQTIATIDAVDADAVVATSIDGHRAYEIRFRTTASVPLFGGDEGTFTIEEGTHRLLALTIEDALVLIVDDVTVQPRDPVDALVQGVIDSVRFDAESQATT